MAKKKSQQSSPKQIPPLRELLRAAIRKSGKSCYELREETGVNHGVILRFLNGERDIRLETAEKLAGAVGLTFR